MGSQANADSLPGRDAGRVIVLDPDDRVLLFRYDDGPPNGRHWSTPGGGLDEGESWADGALRELVEETGWTDVPLGDEVFEHVIVLGIAGALVRQHERMFLARVETARRAVIDVDGMHASDGIAAWRWWSAAEIDATTEKIFPPALADLIRDLSR
jgi:ADP-ribose pyrophosphatase YjhB (NUDIX family)